MTPHSEWHFYKFHCSLVSRARLIRSYVRLVYLHAEMLHARLPKEVDIDDLVGYGNFGLMDAIDKFDLAKKVKFETFSAPRIRGAILDGLREMDWVPRLVRNRAGKWNEMFAVFTAQHGRQPTDEEARHILSLSGKEYKNFRRDVTPTATFSIDNKLYETDADKEVVERDMLEDPSAHNQDHRLAMRDLLKEAYLGLSRAEQTIIALYYMEEMTMKQIAAVLDLSESRVSQMHSKVIGEVKVRMVAYMREHDPDQLAQYVKGNMFADVVRTLNAK